MPFRMAARQSPVALEMAVIPPRPSGSASVAAQSRFCRSLKILKRGIDFSEMIDSMSLSIPEYSKSLTVVQEKLRNSYLRINPKWRGSKTTICASGLL